MEREIVPDEKGDGPAKQPNLITLKIKKPYFHIHNCKITLSNSRSGTFPTSILQNNHTTFGISNEHSACHSLHKDTIILLCMSQMRLTRGRPIMLTHRVTHPVTHPPIFSIPLTFTHLWHTFHLRIDFARILFLLDLP